MTIDQPNVWNAGIAPLMSPEQSQIQSAGSDLAASAQGNLQASDL